MYQILLGIHSVNRWLVLGAALGALILAAEALMGSKQYGKGNRILQGIFIGTNHLQLLVGLILMFGVSPITTGYFNGGEAGSETKFFIFHHGITMILSVAIAQFLAIRVKKAGTDVAKLKTTLYMVIIPLVLILAAYPWNRPSLPF